MKKLFITIGVILSFSFLTIFLGIGCSSSSDDDDGGTPTGAVDNSRFYGTYEVTMQIGSCDEETSTITIGNDQSRDTEDDYMYIPQDTNSATFTLNGEDVTVTVSGYTVTVERAGSTWTFDIEIEFFSDESITVTGTATSDDPEDCTGTITAIGTKVSGGGGGTTDISGVWNIRVYNINSSCGGEDEWNSTVTITQTGDDLTVTGSKKGEAFSVNGTVSGGTVTISGNFSEEGGTTTATYTLAEVSDGYMTGNESWTWTDDVDDCTGGTALVTMTRQ